MSKSATKYCSNCCQDIDEAKFFLHERMCSLNVKKCPKCNKPFTLEDLEDHMNEEHVDIECEYCKKKFPKAEIEKHKKRCDSRMVQCTYCELEVLLGEIKEHQKSCGAITELCPICQRYIQRKDMDNHLIEGCPPPKNDRRSVDVVHNSNSKNLLDTNKNNNIINNYNPINFNPEDILKENIKGKVDIKIHNNINKPNLGIRPSSGKKILNDNIKKNMSNLGGKKNNNHEKDSINNIINNKNNTKAAVKAGAINNFNNNINNNNKTKTNNYMNKHSNNKGPITVKPVGNNISNNNKKKELNSSRYNLNNNNNKNIGKINAKPSFATNLSKGNLNLKSSRDGNKKSDEEFRKTREKLNFPEAKKIEKLNLNKDVKNSKNSYQQKGIINDEDYIANFNFGEVDDDQLLQQVIEQSLKAQNKK